MTLLTCAMRPAKFVTQLGDARTIPEERAARGLPHGRGGRADIRLWQQCNPVVTEALVQLTWGGPQVIYNGGLQQARVRYHDADRRRPGLPASVAALVSDIDPRATGVDLVILHPDTPDPDAGPASPDPVLRHAVRRGPPGAELAKPRWPAAGGGRLAPGVVHVSARQVPLLVAAAIAGPQDQLGPVGGVGPGSSRHLPEAGLTRVPLLACHCWFPPPLQSHSSIRVPLP